MSAPKYPKDLTGLWFGDGNLEVLKRLDDHICPSGAKQSRWLCRCHHNQCGRLTAVLRGSLVTSHTRSCGCHKLLVARRQAAINFNAGVLHERKFSDERLRVLYHKGLSAYEIARIARESHDDPGITAFVVYGWLRCIGIRSRSQSEAQGIVYRRPNQRRFQSSVLKAAINARKERGEYFNPANFAVNPSNRRKATEASVVSVQAKAKARHAKRVSDEAARRWADYQAQELERILDGGNG